MFKINKHKPIVSDLPIITQNRLDLLSDENPILYTGTNQYGNRILGIIVEESEEDYTVRYFHIIINDDTYYAFINHEITLRKIIETAGIIFIMDYNGGKLIDNNLVTLEDIPKDYLPLEDSFCPQGFFIPSLNFGVSLKGKKSEMHIVEVQDANDIQTSFADVLRNALQGIGELDLSPKCYLEPAETGSFRVNYRIEFENKKPGLFHIDPTLIADYLKSFLNYVVTKLPREEQNVLKDDTVSSNAFNELEAKLNKVYVDSHIEMTEEVLEQKLIENINESALKFENVTNQIKNSSSFDKIELINYQSDGNGELGLGIIDQTFFDTIREQLIIKPEEVSTDVYEEDRSPRTYRIRVYHLNTDTGNCWAYFYPDPETEENYKIPVRINKGEREYHNSILSKSLDEKKVVSIQARAERINHRTSKLMFDL